MGAPGGVAQRAPRARRVEGGGRAGHDGPRLGGLGRGGGAAFPDGLYDADEGALAHAV